MGQEPRALALRAAFVDALLEIDRAPGLLAEGRVAGSDPAHRGLGVAMAVGAGALGRTGLPAPQRLAVAHPQHARIGAVVALHALRLAAHEVEAEIGRAHV